MSGGNITYHSPEILDFYRNNRQRWEEFYPSERHIFEKVSKEGNIGDVLDVGCACGGLGAALCERFTISSYTGIDINEGAVAWARNNLTLPVSVKLIAGDILKCALTEEYDTVVSLSCADWNIETASIITACWQRVKPGGHLIISLRTTPGEGTNDITKCYQYINFSGTDAAPEIANYVVFNFRDAVSKLVGLSPKPELVSAYGYWGAPSVTAVTPYSALVFTVFSIRKPLEVNLSQQTCVDFQLPLEVLL